MDNLATPYVFAGALAIATSVYVYIASKTTETKARQLGARLAPGPKRMFLLGNLFDFPKNRWYETFTSWGKQYGDVVYISLAGIPMVILNSLEAAEELAGKRAAIYSGRPYTKMVCGLMGAGYSLPFLQQGPEFNEQRKLFRTSLGPHVLGSYDRLIQQTIESFISDVRGFEGDPYPRVARSVSTIVTTITYGEQFYKDHGEALVQLNIDNIQLVSWAFTRFWAVDVLHFLRYVPSWFPGTHFQQIAKTSTEQIQRIRFWPFGCIKDAVAKGTADESMVSRHLNDPAFSDSTICDTAAIMYSVGVDTTSTALTNLLYALFLHPEWQSKLQKELDEVVGRGHLPTAKDIPKLKLFYAVWKESFRLYPPVPLGVPHVSTEADVYNGLYIPQGSMIHCNIGAMLRDSRVWGEDSEDFNPNRFLSEFNPKAESLPDVSVTPFGFGRRICPGRFLAEKVGCQLAASVLSVYSLTPAEGEPVTPTMIFEDTTIRRPINFKCHFKPRSH
ncbi:hypothetical protein FRB91_004275 [Serendipita sp. 411]|nr:hypothetical protein FRC15_003974 [Serendipita sp. 397]KAG8777793.1 hypothetical protein FRC16_004036 [Serendipita sp. 398]KAG8809349.1 hypothetical protein FRC18_004590 [Serendipita sp. 400]KAG8811315.1 hypothetical protein FRC19_003982 [Serendipita sp. 401]KAG8842270.1 hypothetical protein FRB91_004275 [Serendipita sp. 411]KAG8847116.1 hypothetical protein FRC20_002820 [Serendipita sp. 405]KAG9041748.1 hypothetical protein FS842_002446 [Serendipita sp. 407]